MGEQRWEKVEAMMNEVNEAKTMAMTTAPMMETMIMAKMCQCTWVQMSKRMFAS